MKTFLSLTITSLSLLVSVTAFSAEVKRGPFTGPATSVRSRDFDQTHVRVDLHFNMDKQEIRGTVFHTLTPFTQLAEIELDAAEMNVTRVLSLSAKDKKNASLKFRHTGQSLSITLDRKYGPDDVVKLKIDYVVTHPEHGAHFVVPDENEPTQPEMVWTQSESEFARYWFPCFDSPTDRFTSEIRANVPAQFFVLSNGRLIGKTEPKDGRRTWRWRQDKTHVAYLMSIVAGEFEAYEQQWKDMPVVSYVPKGRMDDAARSFEKTPEMVEFFTEKFGYRYPWPKYTQICVDEYAWGGMEHTSATTLTLRTLHDERANLDVSSEGLVAHELVHQWYGDLITCKDWAELWLNEGFATYFTTVWTAHDLGLDEAAWQRHKEAESYFGEDSKRYRRSIVTYQYKTPDHMFDRHSYPKAGRVLHMLRGVLGEELFWKSIQYYTNKHAFDTVETAEFRDAVEETTGQGLNWFFNQWLHRGGHPEYNVSYDWDAKQKQLQLTVKQTQAVDDLTPLFRMPIEIEFVLPGKRVLRTVTVAKAEETFHFSLPTRPTIVYFDPADWVLKKLTFEKSKQELLEQLVDADRMIGRHRAARALVQFREDADVTDALLDALANDPFWSVREKAAELLGGLSGDAVRQGLLQAAAGDPKSFVRRKAITSLGKFSHDETRTALRKIIADDESYYAAAEAIRSLVKVDRNGCREELLAALTRSSHNDVILKAAADALADLKDPVAARELMAMLEAPATPSRRIAVLGALAKMSDDCPDTLQALSDQIDDARFTVRRAVCEALGKTGNPEAIEILLTRRNKETASRMLQTIDDAIEQLRQSRANVDKLRKDLDTLKKQNQALSGRVQKLESVEKK